MEQNVLESVNLNNKTLQASKCFLHFAYYTFRDPVTAIFPRSNFLMNLVHKKQNWYDKVNSTQVRTAVLSRELGYLI